MNQKLRQLAINVLDDGNGISNEAFVSLNELANEAAPNSCNDIFNAVSSADGRFFLPEDHGLAA